MGLLSPIIRQYLQPYAAEIRGRLLDVGCGNLPHRGIFSQVDEYVGLDREIRFHAKEHPDVIFKLGTADKFPFESNSFDAVVATQVIEHLPEPALFFEEACRVLKPFGKGIITFPLVNPLHEVPYDYWRYTEYGVRHLCERSGLDVECVVPMGGGWLTMGFILYHYFYVTAERQASVLRKSFLHRVGRGLFRFLQWIDKKVPFHELPVNYLVIFQKRMQSGNGQITVKSQA